MIYSVYFVIANQINISIELTFKVCVINKIWKQNKFEVSLQQESPQLCLMSQVSK